MTRLALIAALLGACHPNRDNDRECSNDLRSPCVDDTGDPDTAPPRVERTDEGQACLDLDGDQLIATVTLEGCASDCITDVQASCELTVDDDTITVTASASWRPPEDTPCDSVCRPVVATCPIPAPSDGAYVLVYGEDLAAVDLADLPACAGEAL